MTRILIVDDDVMVRITARLLLEEAGYEVVEANGGAAALRMLPALDVELVLCDLFMPDVDGLEVIDKLRRKRPDLKIVAMSGGGFDGTVNMLPVAQRLGAAEIVQKPFVRRALLDAIDRALHRPPDAS